MFFVCLPKNSPFLVMCIIDSKLTLVSSFTRFLLQNIPSLILLIKSAPLIFPVLFLAHTIDNKWSVKKDCFDNYDEIESLSHAFQGRFFSSFSVNHVIVHFGSPLYRLLMSCTLFLSLSIASL